MKKVFIIIAIAGILILGTVNYHFILLDNGLKILKKADMAFENTFVDARGAKKIKLILNPALIKSGIKNLIDNESVTIKK
jgi:hypothetical protein